VVVLCDAELYRVRLQYGEEFAAEYHAQPQPQHNKELVRRQLQLCDLIRKGKKANCLVRMTMRAQCMLGLGSWP